MRRLLWVALLALAGCVQAPPVPPKPEPTPAERQARAEAEAAALQQAALEARVADAVQRADAGYAWGYPLLVGEMLRLQMSGADRSGGFRAPANSFWHARQLPRPGEPRHPLVDEADLLASYAWLDLGRQAVLLTEPPMGRRFYLLSLHSQWMLPLHVGGSSVGGGRGQRWLVAGPEWQGPLPPGATLLRSPTRHVLVSLGIQTSGSAADLRAVQALQQRWRLVPQTQRLRQAPAESATAPPLPAELNERSAQQLVADMDTATAFQWIAHLSGSAAPPLAADEVLLPRLAEIGLAPGQPFRTDTLEPAVQAALAQTGPRVQQRLQALQAAMRVPVGRWQVLQPGDLAADPWQRAAVAALQWPGPQPQQLLELHTRVDDEGRPLDGLHDYQLRFGRDGLPPVDGPWSVGALQPADGRALFVPNDAGRVALGSRDRLPAEADGSVALFVQYLSPGLDDAARWLPVPKGPVELVLRLYGPRAQAPSALPPGQGAWLPPAPRRVP